MNASLFHFGQSGDRSLQFAFECAPVVHLLGEIARSETGLVEQLKTDSSTARQTGTRKSEARFGQTARGDLHCSACLIQLEIDAGLPKFLCDSGRIFGRKRTRQNPEV